MLLFSELLDKYDDNLVKNVIDIIDKELHIVMYAKTGFKRVIRQEISSN